MAIKFLAIAAVLSASILMPIHSHFGDDEVAKPKRLARDLQSLQIMMVVPFVKAPHEKKGNEYLWAHLIFVYLFSGLSFYLLYTYTLRVIRVRQDYLGHQCTITDRTIRLSAIPREMRSEQAIKSHVEGMGIGTVDSVTICRDWKTIDDLMEQRDNLVRKLEEAWTVYLSRKGVQRNMEILPFAQQDPQLIIGTDEEPLLNGHGRPHYNKKRPQITLRQFSLQYCIPKLSSKKVDVIDYYTKKLEALDAEIEETRKQDFRALPLAFVTLNSVAAAVSVKRYTTMFMLNPIH